MVHKRRGFGWDLHLENADVFVFQGEMMIGFVGDFHGRGRAESRDRAKEKCANSDGKFHADIVLGVVRGHSQRTGGDATSPDLFLPRCRSAPTSLGKAD